MIVGDNPHVHVSVHARVHGHESVGVHESVPYYCSQLSSGFDSFSSSHFFSTLFIFFFKYKVTK